MEHKLDELITAAEIVLAGIETIPVEIRDEVQKLCRYILEKGELQKIMSMRSLDTLNKVGIQTLAQLMKLDSKNLFLKLRKQRKAYRYILRDLERAGISHRFIEKPWEVPAH